MTENDIGLLVLICLAVPAYTLFAIGILRGWGDDDD